MVNWRYVVLLFVWAAGVQATPIPEEDILRLDASTKAWLDEFVRPVKGRAARTEALHAYLFTPVGKNIQYRGNESKTAQETIDSGFGDCVSLANIYVASARYLKLRAQFQKVRVPRDWQETDEFYILPDHMNVRVRLGGGESATVELISTNVSNRLKDKPISDAQAFADFYSNKGVEALVNKAYAQAISHLEKATQTDAKSTVAWSNLGVAYKLSGDLARAEKAYLQAIKLDRGNLSSIKNLYVLYSEMGREEKTQQLSKRVLKYAKRNPYFLHKAGQILITQENYSQALTMFNQAIKKKKDEARFYRAKAQVHYLLGDVDRAKKAQKNAVKHSQVDQLAVNTKKYQYLMAQ